MNTMEKLETAGKESSMIRIIAEVFLPHLLEENEKAEENFLKEDRTWSELAKYLCERANKQKNNEKTGGNYNNQCVAVADNEVFEWVKEFYLLDELPKKPVTPVVKTATKPASGKKAAKPVMLPSQSRIGDPEEDEAGDETESEDNDDEACESKPVVAKVTVLNTKKSKEYEGQLSLF